MKNTIVDDILIEDMNWNTLMRLISKKQKSSELIKLPVKVLIMLHLNIYRTWGNWKKCKNSLRFGM